MARPEKRKVGVVAGVGPGNGAALTRRKRVGPPGSVAQIRE